LKSKDPKLREFYDGFVHGAVALSELLRGPGPRAFWVVGEAFPLGIFDEDTGRPGSDEELINPEDVVIENFPILNSQQLKIAPPDYLKRLAQLKKPG
jgi:hypothetical protein